MRLKLLVLLVVVSFLFTPTLWADSPAPITAKLDLLEVNENDQISVSIKFTLKNESENPIKLLKWGTPFEGEFTQDTFKVTVNGDKVPYIGKLVKRLPPSEEDYITIKGNSELSEIVYLEDGYKIYAPGFYTVQIAQETVYVDASQNMKFEPFLSESVEFEIIYGINEADAAGPEALKSKCTSSQFDTIKSAYDAAKNMAAAAKRALHNAPISQRPQARRYLEWFGAYEKSRYSKVTSNFDKVHDVLFNKSISIVCPVACSNMAAFVYPSRPYTIYFCDSFFRCPLAGAGSKAGIIIHELSHFNIVARTDDVVYGRLGARQLARQNPNQAIRNADSHEFFAENAPSLPMPTGGGGENESGERMKSGGGCFVQSLK